MIYGEVGKLPLQVTIDKHLINYWLRLLDKEENTLAYIIYRISLNLFCREEYKGKWLCKIKCILANCGLSYIWLEQDNINTKECKLVIHERIEDIELHSWLIDMSSSSMCIFYRLTI